MIKGQDKGKDKDKVRTRARARTRTRTKTRTKTRTRTKKRTRQRTRNYKHTPAKKRTYLNAVHNLLLSNPKIKKMKKTKQKYGKGRPMGHKIKDR